MGKAKVRGSGVNCRELWKTEVSWEAVVKWIFNQTTQGFVPSFDDFKAAGGEIKVKKIRCEDRYWTPSSRYKSHVVETEARRLLSESGSEILQLTVELGGSDEAMSKVDEMIARVEVIVAATNTVNPNSVTTLLEPDLLPGISIQATAVTSEEEEEAHDDSWDECNMIRLREQKHGGQSVVIPNGACLRIGPTDSTEQQQWHSFRCENGAPKHMRFKDAACSDRSTALVADLFGQDDTVSLSTLELTLSGDIHKFVAESVQCSKSDCAYIKKTRCTPNNVKVFTDAAHDDIEFLVTTQSCAEFDATRSSECEKDAGGDFSRQDCWDGLDAAFKFMSAASKNCPKGYVRFKSGNFMVLGECQSDTEDVSNVASFDLECNAAGDGLLTRTFDEAGCGGTAVKVPLELSDYDVDAIEEVHCPPHNSHNSILIRDVLAGAQSECQWAQLAVYEANECSGDARESAVPLTLPVGMCSSTNNENAADLLGKDRSEIESFFWRLKTVDCVEFEASVYTDAECVGDTAFSPSTIITTESAQSNNGLCFETTKCEVNGVSFDVDHTESRANGDEKIAIILVVGTIAFCFTCFVAAVVGYLRMNKAKRSHEEIPQNDGYFDSDAPQKDYDSTDAEREQV